MTKFLGQLVTDLAGSIQDCQFNYYGNKLAIGDSEGYMEIQHLDGSKDLANNDEGLKRERFQAHDGPIWRIAWANPECGNLLASCSYDKTIKIWSEENCKLTNKHTLNKYTCSVNCIEWAPPEYGIMLIAGLSSGDIGIIKFSPADEQWIQTEFKAHESSINALSVCKYQHKLNKPTDSGLAESAKQSKLRFVSCSCDNQVYEWYLDNEEWKKNIVGSHEEWIRDVCYAPQHVGVDYDRVVSGAEDCKVKIWKKINENQKEGQEGEWVLESEIVKEFPVWRTEFNPMGNLLSVCCGDNQTSVYKEKTFGSGEWTQDSLLNEDGVIKDK